MIVNLLEAVVDRCIQLLNKQAENRKQFYTNQVMPLMNNFEELHRAYMDALEEAYNNMYMASDIFKSMEKLADNLHNWAIFKSDPRTRLWTDVINKQNLPQLENLISAVNEYLMEPSFWFLGLDQLPDLRERLEKDRNSFKEIKGLDVSRNGMVYRTLSNVRAVYEAHLRELLSNEKNEYSETFRKARLKEIEQMTIALQDCYASVYSAHNLLRSQLL